MVLFSFIFLPAMIVRFYQGWFQMLLIDLPLFMAATMSVSSFYMISQREIDPKGWKQRLKYLPFMMSVGIGLSVSNSRAVIEALFGIQTSFKRTPKYCIESAKDRPGAKDQISAEEWLYALSGACPGCLLCDHSLLCVLQRELSDAALPHAVCRGLLLHGRDVSVSESFRALPWPQDPSPIDWAFGKTRCAGFAAAL